ncbi:MAG: IS3 family transposase [Thermoleophilia bacterium]
MGKTKPPYAPEFRAEAIRLVRSGGVTQSQVGRDLGVSRSGYHVWKRRRPSARSLADAALTERIEAIHEASRGIYGAPRIQAELADDHAICVGRKRVARSGQSMRC